jgi:AcrR family transcriptional regulator
VLRSKLFVMGKKEQLSDKALTWLDPAVDFVLSHGLAGLTLRPLAAALGTSDRMVMYHFGSKEHLLACIVERGSERLAASMMKRFRPAPKTAYEVILRFWKALTTTETEPYVRLYFELWAAAAREPAYAKAAQEISARWLALIESMFIATGENLAPGVAVDTLAGLDGLVLLRGALGKAAQTDAAAERLATRLTRSLRKHSIE